MTELVVDSTLKRLPFGIYKADLNAIHQVFVLDAPNSEIREQIFSAFLVWIYQIRQIIPEFSLWVNGGFITHKDEPPKDIDVVMLIDPQYLSSLSVKSKYELFTEKHPTFRIQPMGGFVDSFIGIYAEADLKYWAWAWTSRFDKETNVHLENAYKGFVEVIL